MEAVQSPTPQQLAEILSRWQAKASTADPDDIRTAGLLSELLSDLDEQGFPVEYTVLHDWEPSRRPGSAQEAVSWAISQWEELGLYLRELADKAERLGCSPQSSGVHDCAEAVCGLMQQLERMVLESLYPSRKPISRPVDGPPLPPLQRHALQLADVVETTP